MCSILLGMLEPASILQVNRHTGRPPGVTPDGRQKPRVARSFANGCPSIVSVQRAPGKRGASLVDALKQRLFVVQLLQICLVYINTLMIQRVLTEPDWTQRMLPDDLRALTPLIYAHVTPYGSFRLDMSLRLNSEQDAVAA